MWGAQTWVCYWTVSFMGNANPFPSACANFLSYPECSWVAAPVCSPPWVTRLRSSCWGGWQVASPPICLTPLIPNAAECLFTRASTPGTRHLCCEPARFPNGFSGGRTRHTYVFVFCPPGPDARLVVHKPLHATAGFVLLGRLGQMPEGEGPVAKGTSPELRELSVPPPDVQGSPRGRLDRSAVAKHTCVEKPPETGKDGDRQASRPVNQTASLRQHAGPKLQGTEVLCYRPRPVISSGGWSAPFTVLGKKPVIQ